MSVFASLLEKNYYLDACNLSQTTLNLRPQIQITLRNGGTARIFRPTSLIGESIQRKTYTIHFFVSLLAHTVTYVARPTISAQNHEHAFQNEYIIAKRLLSSLSCILFLRK
uniref:Uncharacterized protein n=1 Tax=Leptocylindrus danicus TaxID=163516 RepID=A0A7S2JV59_9STRA